MKKVICFILIFLMAFSVMSGCVYTPPEIPQPPVIVPPGDDDDDDDEDPIPEPNLPLQTFTSAMQAYNFGQEFFANAEYYETAQFGIAVAMGFNTYVLTKRYKSDVSENFLYETNTYSGLSSPDPTFTLKGYKKHSEDTIHYARVDGKNQQNGAQIDPNYSQGGFMGATADFTGLTPQTKTNWNGWKADIAGNMPEQLTIYKISQSTLKRQISFETNKNGFAYWYSISLVEGAVEDYKAQVGFYSKQAYSVFNPYNLDDGLVLTFGSDKYGRIQQINIQENYRVWTGGAAATVVNQSTEYISYNKRPVIDALDTEGKFKGPNITYAKLADDVEGAESLNLIFDPQGGSAVENKEVYFNSAVGELPIPQPPSQNHTFMGWYSQKFGQGTEYTAGTIFTGTEDITLYALWKYTNDDEDTAYVLSGTGNEITLLAYPATTAELVIPEKYNDLPITALGEEIFKNNTVITSVSLHKNIKTIGASAFSGAANLQTLTLPQDSQLQTIEQSAFYNCSKLASFDLPQTLVSIGDNAFYYNSQATTLHFPQGFKHLGEAAFIGCQNLVSVTYAEGIELKTISGRAFFDAQKLPIVLPEGLEYIGEEAFKDAGKHTTLTAFALDLPKSLKEIGNSAFNAARKINALNFAEDSSLEVIGASAFYSCDGISNDLVIPASVYVIGASAFDGAKGITGLSFEEGSQLQVISSSAFATWNNFNVTQFDVVLPESIVEIGNSAFATSSRIKSITFTGNNLKKIGEQAFNGPVLTSVSIPSSVEEIGNRAFFGRSALTQVEFGTSSVLKTIGDEAFSGCTQLSTITIPASVTSIGHSAFYNTKADFSITFMSENHFKKVDGIVYTADFTTVVMSIIAEVNEQTQIDSRVTTLYTNAFRKTSIAVTSLPAGIKVVADNAFYDCKNLTTMDLTGVTAIGAAAFRNTSLTEITLTTGLKSIGNHAFNGSSLQNVVIPNTVDTLGTNVFDGSRQLASVTLPSTLEKIPTRMFNNCSALTQIEIPATVTVIEDSAFSGCTALTTVVIRRSSVANESITTLANANVFGNTPSANLRIYVPADSVDAYTSNTNWSSKLSGKILSIEQLPVS